MKIEQWKKRILFEILFQGNPSKIRPTRNHSMSMYCPHSVYHKLFPHSEKLPAKENTYLYRYHTIKSLYREEFRSVEGCQELFGKEWFITHFEQSVGLHVGKISFTLKEKTITQMKTMIEEHCNTKLMDGSLKKMSCTFLTVSFQFTRFSRRQFGVRKETDFWRKRVRELLRKKNVRKQVIKKIN